LVIIHTVVDIIRRASVTCMLVSPVALGYYRKPRNFQHMYAQNLCFTFHSLSSIVICFYNPLVILDTIAHS